MSFFKSSSKVEDVKQEGGKYINNSGMYPVGILASVVSLAPDPKKKGVVIDFFVDHAGQEQIVYGSLRITNNNGEVNKIGSKTFNQLLVVAGLEDVADPVDATLPIGKAGADKPVAILEDLMDIDVVMRVQLEYGAYNGNITEKKNIRAFYRAGDNATAEEIVMDSGFGEGYKKDLEYAGNVAYKDGTDAEMIKEWISAKRPKGTAGGSTTAVAAPSFTKKRFGN